MVNYSATLVVKTPNKKILASQPNVIIQQLTVCCLAYKTCTYCYVTSWLHRRVTKKLLNIDHLPFVYVRETIALIGRHFSTGSNYMYGLYCMLGKQLPSQDPRVFIYKGFCKSCKAPFFEIEEQECVVNLNQRVFRSFSYMYSSTVCSGNLFGGNVGLICVNMNSKCSFQELCRSETVS